MSGRRAVCIGGGITGVLTARELALAGWDVVVLEARHVGAGSSSRTAAGIRQQFSTPESVRGMRYAVDFYRRFTAEVEDRTCPIVQSGYLFLYDAEESWVAAQRRVEMQHGCGLQEVEALAGDDLRRRFPWCGGSSGGSSAIGNGRCERASWGRDDRAGHGRWSVTRSGNAFDDIGTAGFEPATP